MGKTTTAKKVAAAKRPAAAAKKVPAAKAAKQPKSRPVATKPKVVTTKVKPAPQAAEKLRKAASNPKPTPAAPVRAPVKAEIPEPVKIPVDIPLDDEPVLAEELVYIHATSTVKAGAPEKSSLSVRVAAQTSAGAAANGNTQPANILVIVTRGGSPVTDLSKDHFTLMEHFEVPGQLAPFSNNITSFRNAGTGAYLLQTKPITGAPWKSGHHLGQILVTTPDDYQGQVAIKIVIR